MGRISRREEALRRREILQRILERLERDFPVGCRVQLSAEGRAAHIFPRTRLDQKGTVVGYFSGVSPNVRWDGRKGTSGYAPEFLERVRSRKKP